MLDAEAAQQAARPQACVVAALAGDQPPLTHARRTAPPARRPARNVRQGIILFVQRVFDLPVIGVFKLLHIMVRRQSAAC